jgi:hypothetical protein
MFFFKYQSYYVNIIFHNSWLNFLTEKALNNELGFTCVINRHDITETLLKVAFKHHKPLHVLLAEIFHALLDFYSASWLKQPGHTVFVLLLNEVWFVGKQQNISVL